MTGMVLVMAKAPVCGRVKTRLGRVVGDDVAARLALRALIDTVTVCGLAFGPGNCRLALQGDLADVADADSLLEVLAGWTVVPQRGEGLAARLVTAHHEVFDGRPLLQIGMDTPQVTQGDLLGLLAVSAARDVALGPAVDGGWWGIAHQDPACVDGLVGVPMSQPNTGALTAEAIERAGFHAVLGRTHRDVDTVEDAVFVAAASPRTLFAEGVRELLGAGVAR